MTWAFLKSCTTWSLPAFWALCLMAPAQAQRAARDATASVAEQYLLAAANQERTAQGLPLLHRDAVLAGAARQHALSMAAHGEISHQFPGEAELSTRASDAGVRFSVIAENVGEAPSAVTIHTMWMRSPGHRTNLLDPGIDSAGISVVARGGELYAVEDFARSVRPFGLEEQESAIAALIAQPGVALASMPDQVFAARQTCALSTGYAGPRRPGFVMRFTSDSLSVLPDELKARLASQRYRQAAVGACSATGNGPFSAYNLAVLLFP